MSVFQNLQRQVLLKYPEMEMKIIGGFFFLRFLCPVLISPEGSNIFTRKISAESRRTLVLITKIVQNMSNRVLFKHKEVSNIKYKFK